MPSTTLKRTAATLGVLAGLLATAGPASAMPIYMKVTDDGVVAAAGTQVGSEGVSEGRAPQGQYDKASPFTAVALSGPAVAASVSVNGGTPPYMPTQGSPLDPTAQGIIMSDGRICNPRWGC